MAEGIETMMAERIVSLSWRLKRVERMNSEAIDVMIAKIETDWFDRRERTEASLLDTESGRSELALGWATIDDFSGSHAVLEWLLMYEKRIESSLYKAMGELQKLQRIRKTEQTEATEVEPSLRDEAITHHGRAGFARRATPSHGEAKRRRDALATETATHSGDSTCQGKKQSQCAAVLTIVKCSGRKGYDNNARSGPRESEAEKSRFQGAVLPEEAGTRGKMASKASHRCY